MTLKKLFVNPLTAALGTGTGALAILDPNVLMVLGGFIWANVGSLFTASSTLGFLVADNVDLGVLEVVVPWIQGLALILAVIFAAKKLRSAHKELQDRL